MCIQTVFPETHTCCHDRLQIMYTQCEGTPLETTAPWLWTGLRFSAQTE